MRLLLCGFFPTRLRLRAAQPENSSSKDLPSKGLPASLTLSHTLFPAQPILQAASSRIGPHRPHCPASSEAQEPSSTACSDTISVLHVRRGVSQGCTLGVPWPEAPCCQDRCCKRQRRPHGRSCPLPQAPCLLLTAPNPSQCTLPTTPRCASQPVCHSVHFLQATSRDSVPFLGTYFSGLTQAVQ